MKNIFTKLGFSLSKNKKQTSDVAIDFFIINNKDGMPKWIWSGKSRKPFFLKYYNIENQSSFVFASLIKLVFFLKLQKYFYIKKRYFVDNESNSFFNLNTDWAIFSETIDTNNRVTLFANNSFYKIAMTPVVEKLLENEHSILEKINTLPSSFVIPESTKISNSILQLSQISNKRKNAEEITSTHLKTFLEINDFQKKSIKVTDWKLLNDLKKDFHKINNQRIPKNIILKINKILDSISSEEYVDINFSQGNFTQWNTYNNNEKLGVCNWELARFDMPKAFDYFHFIMQNGILSENKSCSKIYTEIKDNCCGEFSIELFNFDLDELKKYLKWYLLINCMTFLKFFDSQYRWDNKIKRQFQVWNEGLNLFLGTTFTNNQLVVMDLFDSIQNEEYASFDFANTFQEQLISASDYDIVSSKNLNSKLINFFKNHSLILKTIESKKTFMNTFQVFVKDSSMFSVDLIWQLKRKNIEFMNIKELTGNNIINEYGIRKVSNINVSRFITLFYLLNGNKFPVKYKIYAETIKKSSKILDMLILECIKDPVKNKIKFYDLLNLNDRNNGITYLQNTINYFYDVFNDVFFKKKIISNNTNKISLLNKSIYLIKSQLIVFKNYLFNIKTVKVSTKIKEKTNKNTLTSLSKKDKHLLLFRIFIFLL